MSPLESRFQLTALLIIDGLAVAINDTKARRSLVVLVNVPENVDLLESSTSDLFPEGLSILNAGDTIAIVGPTDGPAGFSDPNPFARRDLVDDSADFVDGAPECVAGVFDAAAFEVWVCICKQLVTRSSEAFVPRSTYQDR